MFGTHFKQHQKATGLSMEMDTFYAQMMFRTHLQWDRTSRKAAEQRVSQALGRVPGLRPCPAAGEDRGFG